MIEFQNVSKTYSNGTRALRKINLHVDDGEFVFIVGSSGAGKSTFLKLITCEERPTVGEIVVGEQKLSELRRSDVPFLRRTMGMVFQDFRLIHKMTVYENVAFAMHVVGASYREIRKRVPTYSAWSICRTRPAATPASFRAASSSAWGLRGRWSTARSCSLRTSRRGISTPRFRLKSSTCSMKSTNAEPQF